MSRHEEVSRRIFLERLAAGALLGAAGACSGPAKASSDGGGWTPPPVLKNPNILVIMVDQLRPPMWLNPGQSVQSMTPRITGLQNTSYNFEQFFVAATLCTTSRAALLTGLYAPQTAMYVLSDEGAPSLNPAFPTWGQAITTLNPAYQGNVWWFGKWHLSNGSSSASPLLPYGFQTRTYPGGAAVNPDPIGTVNEGTDGTSFHGQVYASDAMVANDFIGWLQGQSSNSSPWCATVSLLNPHDICYAPAWFQASPFPPSGVLSQPVYFPPPSGSPPSFYGSNPSPWNYENLPQVPNKPTLQYGFLKYLNTSFGSVSNWTLFLNQYFWLQNFVDYQVGQVLQAVQASAFANNTVIVFLSDHGEHAGSHGLHSKGCTA